MAAANMYVTPAGAGTKAGDDWDNAMGLAEWVTDMTDNAEAGDVYYVYGPEQTYTLTANMVSAKSGTAADGYIKIVATSDQEATPTEVSSMADMPTIACAGYYFSVSEYWEFRWCNFTGTAADIVTASTSARYVRCKSYNSSLSANRTAFEFRGIAGIAIGCDARSTLGFAFLTAGNYTKLFGCYIHDSNVGIDFASRDVHTIIGNIFDTLTLAMDLTGSATTNSTISNTFYNCTTALSISGTSQLIFENIFAECTTAISFDAASFQHIIDWNNYWDNGTDTVNATKGPSATAVNPGFTDAPGGDFSLSSAMGGGGFPGLFQGELSRSYSEQGAVQSAISTVYVAPTFAGITQLEDIGGGCLRATWSAATGDCTGYKVYVRDGSASVFSADYLKAEIDSSSTEFIFRVDADNETLLASTSTYHVGVRSTNEGTDDSNTTTKSSAISGDGSTFISQKTDGAFRIVKNL